MLGVFRNIQCLCCVLTAKKNLPGKSKEQLQHEKRQDLERRLDDVQSQLNKGGKKTAKKGRGGEA